MISSCVIFVRSASWSSLAPVVLVGPLSSSVSFLVVLGQDGEYVRHFASLVTGYRVSGCSARHVAR